MKTMFVLAVLLAATPAFAQYGQYGGSPGATMQDYRLGPHHRTMNPMHHPARTGGGSRGYNAHIHHTGTAK